MDSLVPIDDPDGASSIQARCISCQTVFNFHQNMVQPASGSLIRESTIAAGVVSQKNYLCTDKLMLLPPSHIVKQMDDERDEAHCPANSTSKKIKGLWIVIAGGNKNLQTLIASRKEFGTCSMFAYLDHFVSDCPTSFTIHPIIQTEDPVFSGCTLAGGSAYWHKACSLLLVRPFSGKIKDSLVRIYDDSNTTEETWCLLPFLLLWMIKDRLDFVCNVRLAAVCRNWWFASQCYPKKLQSAGDGLPWIMQPSRHSYGRAREFICVSRREKFTIDVPELCGAANLFSKEGWLLSRRKNFSGTKIRLPDSVFLFNLFTKAKIEMPDVEDSLDQYVGSFSTIEGYPNCVVLVMHGRPRGITLKISCPGDEVWTEHSYIAQGWLFDGFKGLAIVGGHVYCFDLTGRMLIYSMESNVWKTLPRSDVICLCYMVERKGEIIKLDRNGLDQSSFNIFRYNDTDVAWEKLNNDDIKETSWFLSDLRNCFSSKEKGSKVYAVYRKRDESRRFWRCDARVHNLVDGSTHTLFPYQLCKSAVWVDMG